MGFNCDLENVHGIFSKIHFLQPSPILDSLTQQLHKNKVNYSCELQANQIYYYYYKLN